MIVHLFCLSLAGVRLPPASSRCQPTQLGLMDWLLAPEPPFESDGLLPEAVRAYEELCRSTGWNVKCSIGSEVARSVGGSGSLARNRDGGSTGELTVPLCFSRDIGYDPPQGAVRLLRSSRFLAAQDGFWKVDADDDRGMPKVVQWRLSTGSDGIVLGEQLLVPPGSLYFNAKVEYNDESGALKLYDGRLTVKEEIGVNTGLFNAKGILAEFKIVGTFEAQQRTDGGIANGQSVR